MVEIRIHGRGGQGGVTLAKLIATARFLQGDSVQAFGLYAAERSGAPVQAFCRYDREPITTRNLIYAPDHVVVLDPTLIGPELLAGLVPGGWIVLNTPEPPGSFRARFPAHRIAAVDATAIARAHDLGTRSVPIVNTALVGAVGRVLDFPLDEVQAAVRHLGFGGGNVEAAADAYGSVTTDGEVAGVEGEPPSASPGAPEADARRRREVQPEPRPPGASVLEDAPGGPPEVKTGAWATEQPRRRQSVPPCNHVCPAGNDVQGFLHALADGRVDDALETLLRTSPFPAVCGRVCPAPCMASCNRIALDGAVNVRQLERYAGDAGSHEPPIEDGFPTRSEWVAVVGSGPGGLTAAYHLARLGYMVTVFEAGKDVGGLLRTGIPDFRLPKSVLDREVGRIRRLGVEMVTGFRVDRRRLLELAADHDAVLVATGLQELRELRPGLGDVAGVEQGILFLDRVHRKVERCDGESVVVVGGGNTAMDAARSALRLGAEEVTVVYRRGREEMPAIREEIDEALEEGVVLELLTQPVSAAPRGGAGLDVTCRRMELGAPDASGRRRPEEVEGSDFTLGCDRLILALGQSPELSVFPEGTEVREGDRLLGLLEKPVYAVGDLATGDGTVAGAIGSGRRAALHVHAALSGEPYTEDPHRHRRDDVDVWSADVVTPGAMRLHLFERAPEREGATLAPEERVSTFDEVHAGLADPSEAKRCLSCGVCNDCDLCVTFCPEGVLKRVGGDLRFDYAYCKGCGICVTECPRNVVFLSHL